MMESEHTPGPWGCCDTSHHAHDYRLTKPNGEPLPVNAPYNDHSEQRANARLIAAAPDLLAALEDIAREAEDLLDSARRAGDGELWRWKGLARAAIAKARGVSC